MEEMDVAFVQAPEHRPRPNPIVAGGIPTIDLSAVLPPQSLSDPVAPALSSLASEIGGACERWGFFEVVNHGVPPELRHRVESAAKKFFSLPVEEKRRVRRDEINVFGYYDTEHTKNVRDWKEVFDFTHRNPYVIPESQPPRDELVLHFNRWPEYPPEMRGACEKYSKEMEKLGVKLLSLIALSLGLPADRFDEYFEEQTTFTRLNHYPPCTAPHLALGVGRHKDGGALTILGQDDVGGLEVRRKTDGEWVFVHPTPDAYIINVGDIIQVWSNERYESVEHRVRLNTQKARLSIPYFINPAHYVNIKPLPELVTEDDPPKYKDYSWGRFFSTRKLSNFKKLDVDNIQIHNFRVPLEHSLA